MQFRVSLEKVVITRQHILTSVSYVAYNCIVSCRCEAVCINLCHAHDQY